LSWREVAAVAEAGTGKSRLVYEFKAALPGGYKVLEAYSVSTGKAAAYQPVLELLHNYFGIEAAVHYLGRAGNQALVRAAYAEAQALLSRGLELLNELPDDAERAREEIGLPNRSGLVVIRDWRSEWIRARGHNCSSKRVMRAAEG
jgi:hypothetical protein